MMIIIIIIIFEDSVDREASFISALNSAYTKEEGNKRIRSVDVARSVIKRGLERGDASSSLSDPRSFLFPLFLAGVGLPGH